jgi:hypothetical protein
MARPEPLYECAADGPKEDFGDMANGESRTAQIGYPASFHGLVVGDAGRS